MKKLNLIKRLWTDSHEKQKMGGMRRYAAMLMMLLTLGVGQMWATKTIYFVNTDDWSTVKCYAWQSSNTSNKNAEWPGVTMNSTEVHFNGHYVYSISLDDSYDKCIFSNNGSNQTSNLDVPTDERNLYYKDYGFWGFRGPIPSNVFSGDDVMFYIQGYGGKAQNYLVDESKAQASTSYKLTDAISYVYTASSNLDTYDRISNNPGSWNGNQHTGIHDATGGELFREDGTSSTTKQTASTTASVTDGTLNISSTTSSATSAYSSLPIYIQYYIDGDFVGVTYSASTATYYSIPAGGSTARGSSLDVSGYAVGNYTLTTVLTDGILYWVADEDGFEVTSATSHAISYTTQSTGWTYGIKPSVGEEDETITFVVTPTDGYIVEVTSSDVTLSGPNEDNEYTFTMLDEDVSINVSATENIYTVTLVNATDALVSAGCATNPSITAATAPFGMTFDHWSVSGGADVASTTSSTTTVSATAAGAVTAVYVQSLYAYIVGRFETHSKNRQSTYYTGNWNTTATNNEFEYDETNHRFVKHTYTTLAELSANKDSNPQYFEIKTTEDHGDLDDASVKYYGKTSNTDITIAGSSNKIAMEQSTATGHPKFNGSTTDKYVVIYLDKDYNLWFEEEDIPAVIDEVDLSVTRVPPTAPITATPTMYDIAGVGTKAYCWGVYTDEECTSKVNSVTFSSLGDGKVQFMAPQTRGTYYLKLTVHSSDNCNATIDDEKIVSFTVTTDQMVFFKNVPGWGNVHFYFLGDDYWSETLGSGCAGRDGGAARGMTRIGNSDVYYYDYSGNSVMTTYLSSHSTCYIAFTDNYKPNSNNFSECQAVYRGDFSACAPMFVPENWITHYLNNAAYYNRGYWTNYMSANSGFTLYVWDVTTGSGNEITEHEMTGSIGNNSYEFTYNFANDPQNHDMPYIYGFKVLGCGGSYYGSDAQMDMTNSTDWNLGTGTNNCGLKVQAKLEHKFILTLAGDGHVQVSVEYPVSVGDYRLLYDDNTQDHPHPSQFIRKRKDGKDTVSMFIRPSETENLKVQSCTGIAGETITWEDYDWNSGSATIDVSGKEDGVYNFYLEQDASGNLTVNTSETKPYSGKYYIRTQSVDGGWNSYKTSSDNLMTYAQYPEDKGYGFNYYKAKWVGSTGTDVTYTIACDYSPSLCDTLKADPDNNPLSASEAASLPHTANIRFGWHSKTNNLKREYINGSSNVSDRFLVMIGDTKLMDENGNALAISGLNANEISFTYINNWIYRCDVTAEEGAAVKLTANYDGNVQYFIGGADKTEEIIGGSGDDPYVLRVTYDFKTNRLMTAWLPNGSRITDDVELNADMMLIREGQHAATQVYFNGSGKSIQDIHTIYGVVEFQYDHMVGKFPNWSAEGAYEYLMYYISFPFDVKVSEIFGCGVRGTNWIIQKYNGAKRAQIGWFAETSTFWETLPGDSTLHANEGYLLILDRISFNDGGSKIWENLKSGNSVYLYFPSTSATSGTISESTATIKVPEHTCTINRSFNVDGIGSVNHKNTDSHWNIIGTPLFENKVATTIATPAPDGDGATTLQFYYAWDYEDNTLSARALSTNTEFLSMHAYMVQYAGDVTFVGAKLTPPPASVAARHMPSDKKNYLIELKMVNENGKSSDAYIELRENACDTFALNEDMYMMRSSSKADLYTFAGNYDVAANVLTVNNHIVPVGMDVKQAGTYRFTMPSAFSGTVTLIDTQAGARTNLALSDYEVALPKGTSNTRFLLEIDIQQMPTAIDGVGGSLKDGKAHKFIENGQMYILQNGIIYDARGNRVQ